LLEEKVKELEKVLAEEKRRCKDLEKKSRFNHVGRTGYIPPFPKDETRSPRQDTADVFHTTGGRNNNTTLHVRTPNATLYELSPRAVRADTPIGKELQPNYSLSHILSPRENENFWATIEEHKLIYKRSSEDLSIKTVEQMMEFMTKKKLGEYIPVFLGDNTAVVCNKFEKDPNTNQLNLIAACIPDLLKLLIVQRTDNFNLIFDCIEFISNFLCTYTAFTTATTIIKFLTEQLSK